MVWRCFVLDRFPDGLDLGYWINGISADGNYAVGYGTTGLAGEPDRAAFWNLNTLTIAAAPDPIPPPTYPTFILWDVSADGSVYIGDNGGRAGYYTNGVYTELAAIDDHIGHVSGISDDGVTIVGQSGPARGPVYWKTDGTGPILLPVLDPDSDAASEGVEVSANGTVICGFDYTSPDNSPLPGTFLGYTAVKWVWGGDVWTEIVLPALDYVSGNWTTAVYNISADGSTPVGYSVNSLGTFQAVYWPDNTTVVPLTPIAGSETSTAFAISDDLTRIVGECGTLSGISHGVVWTNGDLVELPAPDGIVLDYGSGDFVDAIDISSDGNVIIGNIYIHTDTPFATKPCVWKWFDAELSEEAEAGDSVDATVVKTIPLRKPSPPTSTLSSNVPSATGQLAYPPVPTSMSSWQGWNQKIANTLNLVLAGKMNNTLVNFTLTPNSGTTTLTMSQIGANSVIRLTPLTPSAAEEVWYVSSRKVGEATITHSDSPSTDRTFSVMVIS